LGWRAEEVFRWAREGVVLTTIAGRYALEDRAKAEQDLTSRPLAGNLVIDIRPASLA
jgi:NADPH:quinone reductase-like Zn-dependent oxidoreductase